MKPTQNNGPGRTRTSKLRPKPTCTLFLGLQTTPHLLGNWSSAMRGASNLQKTFIVMRCHVISWLIFAAVWIFTTNVFCHSIRHQVWKQLAHWQMGFAHNLAGLNYQSIAQKKLLDDLVVILTSAVLAHTVEALDILCGGKLGDLWHHPNPTTQTTLVIDKWFDVPYEVQFVEAFAPEILQGSMQLKHHTGHCWISHSGFNCHDKWQGPQVF